MGFRLGFLEPPPPAPPPPPLLPHLTQLYPNKLYETSPTTEVGL